MTSNADGYEDRVSNWDYRYSRYPQQYKQQKHPHDQSLATYRGHSVLRTLIRCYFSPTFSMGQKYIYTGSYDASVCIYDVGRVASKPILVGWDREGQGRAEHLGLVRGRVSGSQVAKLKGYHQLVVRDCSCYPFDPMLVSSSWDGQIAKWSRTCSDEDTSELD